MHIVKCPRCSNPVLSDSINCPECGAVVIGADSPLVSNEKKPPSVKRSLIMLGAWYAVVLVLSGFSLSPGAMVLLSIVTVFFVLRILKAIYF